MPKQPLIVVDADIPYVDPVLGPMGDLVSVPGHRIGPAVVRKADALVVRSVTNVNEALLAESAVRFVGSATSGVDHVDAEWLSHRGISFADAAGANAESVVEYVLASIAAGLGVHTVKLPELSIGIVGCGRIGGRLARRAKALGMNVLCNDPPLVRRGEAPSDVEFVGLHDLVGRSDIVSVHVPLERDGPDSTIDLVNEDVIRRMTAGAWLIQSSRGGTVDEAAAVAARRERRLGFLVLDVWANEPEPAAEAVAAADIATPHIAGYSRDAKLSGLFRIRDALSRSLGVPVPAGAPLQDTLQDKPPGPGAFVLSSDAGPDPTDVFLDLVPRMIDIRADDARFRREMAAAGDRAERFHELRATYPARWAFSRYRVTDLPDEVDERFLTEGIGVGAVDAAR